MLGSVIPRRWIFSLALVGLVSVMVATYSTVWLDPAMADGSGTGPGTGTGTSFSADNALGSATNIAQGVRLNVGQSTSLQPTVFNANGVVDNNLPDITYEWSVSGSAVSISGSTTSSSATIVGSSAGTAVLTVKVIQGTTQLPNSNFFTRDTTIAVIAPAPTPTAAPAPTNPGPVPNSIPNSQAVLAPASPLLISTSGVESGNNAQGAGLNDRAVVFVPAGAVTNFFGINVRSLAVSSLPGFPDSHVPGSSAADINFVDGSGAAQSGFRLLKSAEICLPVAPSDLQTAGGGFTGVHLLRYNSVAGHWVQLSTTYNAITNQACARSSNFSTFALGLVAVPDVEAPPEVDDGVGLPATGGWSPDAGLLLLMGALGAALVGGGAVTMRRARGHRPL